LAAAGDTSDEAKWPADGRVDGIEETPEIDPLDLALAPLHSHLNSPHTGHAAAVVAVNIKVDGDDPRPEGGSAILARRAPGEGHLPSFPEVSFLDFTMNSTWDEATRHATIESIAGADTVRLLFKGKKGDNWAIWLHGRADYTVPTPSALVPDVTEDRATDTFSALISNFDLSDPVTLGQLRQPGAPTLGALLHTVDRTSFVGLETFGN
ncbi:MAG: hypothetical protein QF464_23035, partial [Myxococcota bacterium]|nr:hypothetical protein [Myxococcota bacterium]